MVVSFKKLFFVGCCLLPLHASASESVFEESWGLTKQEIIKIKAGRLVTHSTSIGDGFIKEVEGFIVIDAPAKDVFNLITDYKQLPEFMPKLERVEVLYKNDDGAKVNYFLDLPFGVKKQYRLQLTYNTTAPNHQMSWKKIEWEGLKLEETIKDTEGYWLFKPMNAQTTLLHYYTRTDPGHVPFGLGWVVDMLTKSTVMDLLKNTRKRAEKQWEERNISNE